MEKHSENQDNTVLSILKEIEQETKIFELHANTPKFVEEGILWNIINKLPKDIPKLKPLKLKPVNFNKQVYFTEDDFQNYSVLDFSFSSLFSSAQANQTFNNKNVITETPVHTEQVKITIAEVENITKTSENILTIAQAPVESDVIFIEETSTQPPSSPVLSSHSISSPPDSASSPPTAEPTKLMSISVSSTPPPLLLPTVPKTPTITPQQSSESKETPQVSPSRKIQTLQPTLNNLKLNSSSSIVKEKQIKYSQMSREEHAQYLDLLKKYNVDLRSSSDSGKLLNSATFQQLIKLRDKLIKEREEYKSWFLDQTAKRIYKYFYYPRFVQKFTENYLEERKRSTIELIPQCYRNIPEKIDLVSPACAPAQSDPILTHEATVLNLGKVIHWENPPLPTPLLSEATNDFYDNTLQASHFSTKKEYRKLKVPVISRDDNVEKLLHSFPVDIVISSSAMVTLIDNLSPNFENQWEIPITVKVIYPTENSQVKVPYKVVLVDKPLTKESLTIKEKNNIYYKNAFQGAGLQFSSSKSIVFPPPVNKSPTPENPSKDQENNNNNNNNQNQFSTYETNENMTYNLWRFGKMRLLVRCRIHGVIPDSSVKRGYRYVGIKTKLEYQKKKGLEITTQNETAKWWIYTFLRPDAHLIIGHIDPLSSTLINVTQRDMLQILTPTCNFNPIYPSKQIFVIFEFLRALSLGQYVLSHKSGESTISISQSFSPKENEMPSQISEPLKTFDIDESSSSNPNTVDQDIMDESDNDGDDDEELTIVEDISEENKPGQKIDETSLKNKKLQKESSEKIKEEKSVINFHQRIKESGVSDLKKIPFVMPAWKATPNHVPFTFPPPPTAVLQPAVVSENKNYHKQVGKYCRSFFTSGDCQKENCPYPHLSRIEIENRLESNPKKKKKKKRKKKRKTPPHDNSPPSKDQFTPNKRQKTHNFHNRNLAPDLLQIVNEIL